MQSAPRSRAGNARQTSSETLLPAATDALLATYNVAGVSVAVLSSNSGNAVCAHRRRRRRQVDRAADARARLDALRDASLSKPLAARRAVVLGGGDRDGLRRQPAARRGGLAVPTKIGGGLPGRVGGRGDAHAAARPHGVGMHYVNGVPRSEPSRRCSISSRARRKTAPHRYASPELTKAPGSAFGYSRFLVLQHLLDAARKPVAGCRRRPPRPRRRVRRPRPLVRHRAAGKAPRAATTPTAARTRAAASTSRRSPPAALGMPRSPTGSASSRSRTKPRGMRCRDARGGAMLDVDGKPELGATPS